MSYSSMGASSDTTRFSAAVHLAGKATGAEYKGGPHATGRNHSRKAGAPPRLAGVRRAGPGGAHERPAPAARDPGRAARPGGAAGVFAGGRAGQEVRTR